MNVQSVYTWLTHETYLLDAALVVLHEVPRVLHDGHRRAIPNVGPYHRVVRYKLLNMQHRHRSHTQHRESKRGWERESSTYP